MKIIQKIQLFFKRQKLIKKRDEIQSLIYKMIQSKNKLKHQGDLDYIHVLINISESIRDMINEKIDSLNNKPI